MTWAWIAGLLAGLATGVISGFGIGGGSLLILYLTAFAGMDQYAAGGVNLLYFLFCAPAALVSHIKNKLVDWKTVLFCTLTGAASSVAAAFAAAAIDVGLLRRLFGVLLLYIGFKELFCKSPKKDNADTEPANGRTPGHGQD